MTDSRVPVRMHALGDRLAAELTELTQALEDEMTGQIPELRGDRVLVELLGVSIRSNLETIVQVWRQVADVETVTTPVGAREYARRLAQHGVSPNALLRAYRIGQGMLLDWAFARIDESETDLRLALETYHAISQQTYRYIDSISEQVVAEYQQERERWLAHRSAVRADLVERLLGGEAVDVDAADQVLGYRLRQRHLGLVLWNSEPTMRVEVGTLESVAGKLAGLLGATGSPMFWSSDGTAAWVWLPLPRDGGVAEPAVLEGALSGFGTAIRVAVGRPAAGVEGFRFTHEDALQAQQVAVVARGAAPRVVSFNDSEVRAVALLIGDLDGARRLVSTSLGGLAVDDEHAARLRETARVFVAQRGSYLATAQQLHLHKNTVKYRIDKAVEERGRPIDEDRFDLELALIAARWLGAAVLASPRAD